MVVPSTSPGDAAAADTGFSWSELGQTLLGYGNEYLGKYLESMVEPGPTNVSSAQASGFTDSVPETPQGEALANSADVQQTQAPMLNKYLMWGLFGLIGLLLLLIILKLVGVL